MKNLCAAFFIASALLALNSPGLRAQPATPAPDPAAAPKKPLPPGVKVLKDIVYSRAGEKVLKLDLYLPETAASKPLPVVVWVHGGGWNKGSKENCPAVWLVPEGYAVASISYRLSQEGKWPAQIEDCRAAVRWLRSNAGKHQLNAARIGAWGASAGGHLVALMGTMDPPANEKISSRVQAVCDWYGPTDLLTMPANVVGKGRTEEDVAKSNGAQLLGVTVKDDVAKARDASALWHVSKSDAPFLIMHGDADPQVPLEQSERLHEKLKEAGVESAFHVLKDGGHGGPLFNAPDAKRTVREFFDRHLKD